MGFLNKLKSAVTGGSATVSLEVDGDVHRGDPATAHIRIEGNQDLEYNGIYLLVECHEEAKFEELEFEDGEIERDTEHARRKVFSERFEIAEAGELSEGDEMELTATFTLPEDANPTLRGEIIFNTWRIQAAVDAFGNDPDSGWVEMTVR